MVKGGKMNSPERQANLLNDLRSNKITMAQFLHDCALWALEPQCWVEVVVKQYPLPPPEYEEYARLSPKDKLGMKPEFFQQLPIKLYLQARSRVLSWNKGKYDQLNTLKEWLPDTQENFKYYEMIDIKLSEFIRWLKLFYPEPSPKSYEEETPEDKKEEQPENIGAILSIFNAGIV